MENNQVIVNYVIAVCIVILAVIVIVRAYIDYKGILKKAVNYPRKEHAVEKPCPIKTCWFKHYHNANLKYFKKFPRKYSVDGGIKMQKKISAIVKELRELIDKQATRDELSDYIDREFIFGAWGEYSKDIPPKMLGDIRGLIIDMYRMK